MSVVRLAQLCFLGFVFSWCSVSRAEVQRYALVIGNDQGAAGEARLSYAESDARKVLGVLQSLGDFPPENSVVLLGQSAADVQRALISLNARIRAESLGPRDTVLFVYYSGHADGRALHLGNEKLELGLLQRLVQGSSAAFRVLLVDACSSGALTRVKGARPAAPFDIRVDEQLSGDGIAFLTSSAADEDAQESDEIQGSFFTHYFVSGLRGAADRNDNGAISVEEAYDYAYQHTLSATSKTLYGLQHPTFRFDLRGKGGIALTWVRRPGRSGQVRLPRGHGYVLFARDVHGPVVAEVDVADARRQIALEPGRYFVRGRAADHLLEGSFELGDSETLDVAQLSLERVEYARLARKGGADRRISHGPFMGYALRSPLFDGTDYCHGVRAGYAVDLSQLSLAAGAGACRSRFSNETLQARSDELGLELSASRVFDLPVVSVHAGLNAGVSWLHQSFDTLGSAPSRDSAAVQLGVVLGVSAELWRGFYLLSEVAGQLHAFKQDSVERGASGEDLTAVFTFRPLLGAGKRF